MRIDRIELTNFKKFSTLDLQLHRQFTLLIGENGAGKTSVLDALAVALGVWLVEVPDSTLANSRRGILPSEIRRESTREGDRELFFETGDGVSIKATGQIESRDHIHWEHSIKPGKQKATNSGAREAIEVIQEAYRRARSGRDLLPIIAYYGAGRAWLPHNTRKKLPPSSIGPAHRWSAFYDCLNERIRIADLNHWFRNEAIEALNRDGTFRPGFEVVRHAILRCVPGADQLWFSGDQDSVMLSIQGRAQPLANLSAGQRMMLAMVADIAIKAVTQNNFLVPDSPSPPQIGPLPEVLRRTGGVVLIDELDVHLHPTWQRRVATDLKATFPGIQFVCTTHSPQVIGEVVPEEIRMLDETALGLAPAQSFGLDSNSILEDVMHAESVTPTGAGAIRAVDDALEDGDIDRARQGLAELRELQRGETRDTARLEATINNLEFFANEGN